MKIVMVASEAAPFARSGGLGDVIGALPSALARLGHEVYVFLPLYGTIDREKHHLSRLDTTGSVEIDERSKSYSVEKLRHRKLPLEYLFVGNSEYFDRDGLYVDQLSGNEYPDNDERFLFFSRAVLDLTAKLKLQPDLIHVHDWQAGLIPVIVKNDPTNKHGLEETPVVLTIHNLAYQGLFAAEQYPALGLPDELFYAGQPMEFYDQVNFLKGAISFADKITTVSPRYAKEIQTNTELGCGLEGVLRGRTGDLVGILNGVDYSVWSPSRDKIIPHRYHQANLGGKKTCKVELLHEAGLPIREKTPLIGIVSRLVDQKGFDLFAEIVDDLFAMNIQMVALGSGDEKYHRLFTRLERDYPDKVKVYLGFDDAVAHKIEAGADIFMMPSRFEPCGLNQMYSLKYGTVPVVHKVGGLADTIFDYDEANDTGNGFVFDKYDSELLLKTLGRAINLYSQRRKWIKLVKRGMRHDFSWDRSAGRYVELFQSAIATERVAR